MLTNTFLSRNNEIIITTPTKKNDKKEGSKTKSVSPGRKRKCTNDHTNITNYNPNSFKSYFTSTYYEKHPNCTQQCVSCYGIFGETIKISTKSPVMCCNNILHKTNPCNHAYCSPCYAKLYF